MVDSAKSTCGKPEEYFSVKQTDAYPNNNKIISTELQWNDSSRLSGN